MPFFGFEIGALLYREFWDIRPALFSDWGNFSFSFCARWLGGPKY